MGNFKMIGRLSISFLMVVLLSEANDMQDGTMDSMDHGGMHDSMDEAMGEGGDESME